MLDHTNIERQSVSKVVKYYSDGADDYYAKEGDANSWFGKGAEALGLKGEVDPKRFGELLDGQIDKTIKVRRFTIGQKKERLGMDLTFNAPKSISLQALVHGDKNILAAHDAAVKEALEEAEMLAKGRKTENGKVHIEQTRNIVAATFRHETNREQEPHLHTHAVIMNMTQREDGEWRALMNDSLVKNIGYLSQVYNRSLARELEKQGFQVRYGKNGAFDLAHISREQIEAFSTRSKQIEDELERQGLNRETANAEQKSGASMKTRKKKVTAERAELHKRWQDLSQEIGIDFESREWAGAGKGEKARTSAKANRKDFMAKGNPANLADDAISYAVKSLGERQTNISETLLRNAALRHAPNSVRPKDIKNALGRAIESGFIVAGEGVYAANNSRDKEGKPLVRSRSEWERELEKGGTDAATAKALVSRCIETGRLSLVDRQYTTAKAIATERAILKMERQGRNVIHSIAQQTLKDTLDNKTLSKEQRDAVEMIVTTKNRYVGVQGYAGVGKSYLTQSAKEILEQAGLKMKVIAPYGSQVESLQADGMDARVMAAFLRGKDKGLDQNTVLFLDEAGVVPATQMLAVMQEVEKYGARLVLLGDTSQTKAIEAGKPFEQLLGAGMEQAKITKIQRQKSNPELLKAVQYAAEKNTGASLRYVQTIHEIADAGKRHQKLAEDYTNLGLEGRLNTVIITGSNVSRRDINNRVRSALGLSGTGEAVTMLSRHDSTQAERQYSRYFEIGTVIVPDRHHHSLGLVRGQQYEVIDNGPGNKLTVRNEAGEIHSFCPEKAQLSVYEQEKGELAVGDAVRFTRNDKLLDVRNGNKFFVTSVETDRIGLSKTPDGKTSLFVKTGTRLFLQPGYSTTAHSAQGITQEKAFLNIETRSRTTTMETYYVGLSRAKRESVIYTDKKTALPQAIARETFKTTALDLKARIIPIYQIQNKEARYKSLVKDYVRLGQNEIEKSVIITTGNESRKIFNKLVREELKLSEEKQITMLSQADISVANLETAKSFKTGMVIVPAQSNKTLGLEKDQQYEVLKKIPGNRLIVQSQDGRKIKINPKRIHCRAYEQEKSGIAPGDSIRVTHTDKTLNLMEGQRLHVSAIKDGKLFLSKTAKETVDIVLPMQNRMFIQPAYAVSLHAAKNVLHERSWLNIDAMSEIKGMEAYCRTRGHNSERLIFTDSISRLTNPIAPPTDRRLALKVDLEQKKKEERAQGKQEANREQEKQRTWLDKLKGRIFKEKSQKKKEGPTHEKAKEAPSFEK